MRRLSVAVLAHRRLVGLLWLVLTVVGLGTAQTTTNRLSLSFSVPGREGFETSALLSQVYDLSNIHEAVVTVVQLPDGTTIDSPGVRDRVAAWDGRLIAAGGTSPRGGPALRLLDVTTTGDRHFVSADGRTLSGVLLPSNVVEKSGFGAPDSLVAARRVVNEGAPPVAGAHAWLTGLEELAAGSSGGGDGPGLLAETLFGGLGALAVLAFVFASFVALVPILIAVVAIATTFLAILVLTTFAEVSFIVQFLVALIGLGVAIDYSLLVVTRWREERANGLSNDDAIHRTMETAGSAVVFSGTTVGVGLLALVVLPVPFLRSVGYAGMLIPIVSVLVAVTLLPVILHSIGAPGVAWPWRSPLMGRHRASRFLPTGVLLFLPRLLRRAALFPNIRKEAHASRGWVAWARLIVRRRWVAALAASVILGALVVPAAHITVGEPEPSSLATSGPARSGFDALAASGLGIAGFQPDLILVSGGKDPASVVRAAAAVPDIVTAFEPTGPAWQSPLAQSAGDHVVVALSTLDPNSGSARSQLDTLRSAVRSADGGRGSAAIGGSRAGTADFNSAVYGSFPLMLGFVVVITFVLLARAFRSLLLPLKAVILNVISLCAGYGVLVLVWQDGHGSKQIFGIDATGAITAFVPLMVFAFLFGLSMDYEVFILARMREEYDATGHTDLAIVRAIGRTGRLVTSAALILFLAFVSLGSGPETDIKIFATGLAAGILLDATVVRALFVPALVSLFGRWNWWLPSLPARLIRVRPSIPREEVPRREILATEA